MVCLARVHLRKRVVIGSYSAKLIYANLFPIKDLNRIYWKGVISAGVKEF